MNYYFRPFTFAQVILLRERLAKAVDEQDTPSVSHLSREIDAVQLALWQDRPDCPLPKNQPKKLSCFT